MAVVISGGRQASAAADEDQFARREKIKRKLAAAFIKKGEFSTGRKLLQCNSRFSVWKAPRCNCIKILPKSCSVRVCPHCEAKRSRRMAPIVMRIFREMRSPKLITLTIPNVKKLTPDVISGLLKSFRRLRGRKAYKSRVRGGFYTLEITNKGKGWHPHIHFLVDCCFWPVQELSKEWAAVSPGSIVDIRAADSGSVRELAKYITKISSIADDGVKALELLDAIRGRRLYGAVGFFYAYKIELVKAQREALPPFECGCGNCYEFIGEVGFESVFFDKRGDPGQWFLVNGCELELIGHYMDRRERAATGGVF